MRNAHYQKSRHIVARIHIQGDLVLQTATSLGNGDYTTLTDMPLAYDTISGKALLSGASIAGALRNYLREWEEGYEQAGKKDNLASKLFGFIERDDTHPIGSRKNQASVSPLIVYDALSKAVPAIELRDGVKLDPATRTAEDKKKFDWELLQAGTCFPLQFELLVIKEQAEALKQGLALALQGLEKGEIALGGRKRRGWGKCQVAKWTVHHYDMAHPNDLVAWLDSAPHRTSSGDKIATLLNITNPLSDNRQTYTLSATFRLETSLLIRSGNGGAKDPDMVHLHSQRNGELVPIISGTSLAGALRARASRIADILNLKPTFVSDLFGPEMGSGADTPKPYASRIIVEDSEIKEGLTDLVHTRLTVDRFTQGAYPGALFNQQPVYPASSQPTTLTLNLHLRLPNKGADNEHKAMVGLLLLLLKDLWTGHLPLGGEASVGRGRLAGCEATLTGPHNQQWQIKQTANGLSGDIAALETFVTALKELTQ